MTIYMRIAKPTKPPVRMELNQNRKSWFLPVSVLPSQDKYIPPRTSPYSPLSFSLLHHRSTKPIFYLPDKYHNLQYPHQKRLSTENHPRKPWRIKSSTIDPTP